MDGEWLFWAYKRSSEYISAVKVKDIELLKDFSFLLTATLNFSIAPLNNRPGASLRSLIVSLDHNFVNIYISSFFINFWVWVIHN